jgi:3'-phosphoadenosine 5'-phosphosulfate sulfotransferase (PAPS reductase)/FAD synthetase
MNTDGRVVVWFSCGAPSAVAAKLTVQKYPDAHVVYCDLFASEHQDNRRFFADVERWIGKPIEVIRSKKYATIEESFEPSTWTGGYMSGPHGAQCTREMKKVPRQDYQLPNDLHVFGLAADEEDRIVKFETDNPDLECEWILRDNHYTEEMCHGIILWSGIPLPALYSEGFEHNNCIGCVKSTSPVYWDRVRRLYPAIFLSRCEQSRRIGCRLIRYHGKRIFLDELPDPITDKRKEENIECGVFCIQEGAVA